MNPREKSINLDLEVAGIAVRNRKAECPDKRQHHEPGIPSGYLDRQAWFKKMSKTHHQKRCIGCGLYVIWVPKAKCKDCGKLVVNLALHVRRYHARAA